MANKCCICTLDIEVDRHPVTDEVMWDMGHNAKPVTNGRCCRTCNANVVIPYRMDHGPTVVLIDYLNANDNLQNAYRDYRIKWAERETLATS